MTRHADTRDDHTAAQLADAFAQAETASDALRILAETYPGLSAAEVVTILSDHARGLRREAGTLVAEAARMERLQAVLAEILQRVAAGNEPARKAL